MLRKIKEPFCGLSHWVGVALSLLGIVILLAMSAGETRKTIAFSVYGFALIGLYTASALYHSLNVQEKIVRVLRKFDHMGIYLLISGTYVPVCVLALGPRVGWILLSLQGLCAAIGILGTIFLKKFPSALNLVLYIVMGWMAVGALDYISSNWPSYAVNWLLAGGVIYTVGALIYALDKPHLIPGKFSAHDLWHLFVLGGSICHFFLMYTYVARI